MLTKMYIDKTKHLMKQMVIYILCNATLAWNGGKLYADFVHNLNQGKKIDQHITCSAQSHMCYKNYIYYVMVSSIFDKLDHFPNIISKLHNTV